jgi:hypothetical protein
MEITRKAFPVMLHFDLLCSYIYSSPTQSLNDAVLQLS